MHVEVGGPKSSRPEWGTCKKIHTHTHKPTPRPRPTSTSTSTPTPTPTHAHWQCWKTSHCNKNWISWIWNFLSYKFESQCGCCVESFLETPNPPHSLNFSLRLSLSMYLNLVSLSLSFSFSLSLFLYLSESRTRVLVPLLLSVSFFSHWYVHNSSPARCPASAGRGWHLGCSPFLSRVSRVTHVNAPCHTHLCLTPHACMSQVTRKDASCHTFASLALVCTHVTHLSHSFAVLSSASPSYSVCGTWLIHTYETFVFCSACVRHGTWAHTHSHHSSAFLSRTSHPFSVCQAWLFHIWGMTHSYRCDFDFCLTCVNMGHRHIHIRITHLHSCQGLWGGYD